MVLESKEEKEFEDEVVQQWEETQSQQCIDPYIILGAKKDDDDDELDRLMEKKIGHYIEEGHTKEGVGRIMVLRTRRAHALLSDTVRRKMYNEHRKGKVHDESYAVIHFANGNYEGEVDPMTMAKTRDATPDGTGMMVLANGERYEGEYADGKKHGVGLQFWSNGDLFLGQWMSDKMSGNGCYLNAGGVRYYGAFVAGKRHGDGRLTWLDGSTYVGQFSEGARAGHGTLALPNGPDGKRLPRGKLAGRYEGQWKENGMHGEGVYKSISAGNYTGQFKSNCFHGRGRLVFPNSDVHEGKFVEGRREGEGRYEWATGDWFEGNFRNSGRDGTGIFVSKDRKIRYSGEFSHDAPHGQGSISHEEENGMMEYEGQFARGLKDGQGTLIWPDTCCYQGQFARDTKHGGGSVIWPDDSEFSGTFAADKRHGLGVFNGSEASKMESGHNHARLETWEKEELVKHHPVSSCEMTEEEMLQMAEAEAAQKEFAEGCSKRGSMMSMA